MTRACGKRWLIALQYRSLAKVPSIKIDDKTYFRTFADHVGSLDWLIRFRLFIRIARFGRATYAWLLAFVVLASGISMDPLALLWGPPAGTGGRGPGVETSARPSSIAATRAFSRNA